MSGAAVWVVSRFIPAAERDAILGDLIEERAARAPNDAWWFWRQLARSLFPLLWAAVRRGRWIATTAAGMAAYGVVKIAESVTAFVWPLLPASMAQSAAVIGCIGFTTMALGGYFAAWMRRGAAVPLAIISTCMVLQWIMTAGAAVPLAWQLYFLVACPAAAISGGRLARARGQ